MIRRLNAVLGSILSPEQWNRTFDNLAEDIMETLAFFLFDGDGSSGRVFGGLSVSGSATNLKSVISRGGAIVYDPDTYSPQNYGMALLRASQQVTHTAPDGTHARYDKISYRIVQSYSAVESVKKKDAASLLESIYRYGIFEFVVTAGSPSGVPLVPATPTGYYSLCNVLIPAGVSAPSGWTYNDVRSAYSFSRRESPYYIRDTGAGGDPAIADFLDYYNVHKGSLQFSRSYFIPRWWRDTTDLDTGEIAVNYARSIGSSRDYTRKFMWMGHNTIISDVDITETISGVGHALFEATATSAYSARIVTLPIDSCDTLVRVGLECTDISTLGATSKVTLACSRMTADTIVYVSTADYTNAYTGEGDGILWLDIDDDSKPVYGSDSIPSLSVALDFNDAADELKVIAVHAVYRNGRA